MTAVDSKALDKVMIPFLRVVAERDRARATAVELEQENAELRCAAEAVAATLRTSRFPTLNAFAITLDSALGGER